MRHFGMQAVLLSGPRMIIASSPRKMDAGFRIKTRTVDHAFNGEQAHDPEGTHVLREPKILRLRPGLKVQLNGQTATAATGQLDGTTLVFVALDGQALPELGTRIGRLKELRAASASLGK